jgi:glyoxylase-like metal-dependent hydrolase (beta-lactamase superfamily II)
MLFIALFLNSIMLPSGFIFVQRDWLSSNSLLISDQNSAFLFDSGYVTHANQLLLILNQHLNGQCLDVLINTHLHSDHCGGNALLQSHFPDLQVHVPESQFYIANTWDESELTFSITGQTCNQFSPTHGIQSGDSVTICGLEWLVYSSPGHDNDSLIFFQPDNRILISADALWEEGTSVIFPEFVGGIGFDNVAATYDLIESLNPAMVLPGHGPLFVDTQKALDFSRKRLEQFHKTPKLHALYAAKVLIKFKMMELQQCEYSFLLNWCSDSHLLTTIHEKYFDAEFVHWVIDVIDQLLFKKALVKNNHIIFNS